MGKASRRKKASINEAPGTRRRPENKLKPPLKPSSGDVRQKTASITFIPILLLLLVSFCVYFNALSGAFVYDDKKQILDNPWIRDIRNIPNIFSMSVWSFRQELSTSNFYRPLMHIVYMLNYHIFGLNPRGFHLVNILFHCGVSVLVFLIIRRLLRGRGDPMSPVYLSPAFIAAMLFAADPIHTEAVTWIAGLPDVSFTFFYLVSLYFYISFRDGAKRGYPLSILSFSVALLFKEPAITLPVILVAYDYLLERHDEALAGRIKRYLPYMVVSGIYLLVRYYALGGFAPIKAHANLGTYESVINVLPLFKAYLTSLLWPFHLNLWHTFHPISSLREATGLISAVVIAFFLAAAVWTFKKNKLLFFGLILLVIPLLPVFYIQGISGTPYAERYLYLPSFGFVVLPAVFLSWAGKNLPHAARGISIALLLIVAAYGVKTVTRNNVWKDSFTLWSETVRESPDSAQAHDELGIAYGSRGQFDRAIAEFQTALKLKPDLPEAHNNLSYAYRSLGQMSMAIAECQAAIRLRPDYAEAHNNLGAIYGSLGQFDRAIIEFQTALRLRPDYEDAHYNLGAAYESQGRLDRAIAEFRSALRLKPDDAKVRQLLNKAASARTMQRGSVTGE